MSDNNNLQDSVDSESAGERQYFKKADKDQKVPLKEKLFFGAADLYGGGAQALITTVYFVFLVNNGLNVALAGAIVMISKLWDAITDPLMGIISDNTRTKWGRRRPYLVGGGLIVILAFFFLFLPLYRIDIMWVKFTIYLVAYMFYNTLSTVINVPYSSMSTEISLDYDEKTKVNTIRLIFSMVSSGISALIPTMLAERLQKGELTIIQFTLIIALVFGTFYCIPLVLAGIKARERTEIPLEKSNFKVKTFLRPLKVKAFVYLLMSYLCAYSCMDLITTNVIFFADYGLGFSRSASLLLIVIMLSYAVMVPLISSLLSKGWSKPKLFRIGIPIYILGIVLLCLYPSGWVEWPIYVFCIMIGVGTSGCQMIPWILFPDVVDVGELKFNDRPTGSFSGLMTFIKKSTSAIAIGITSFILGLEMVGFVPPTTDYATGIVTKYTQPITAVWGLRMIIMIPVLIFISLAFFFARKLKMNPERSRKISQFILLQQEGKLNEKAMSAEDWAEYKLIEKELF